MALADLPGVNINWGPVGIALDGKHAVGEVVGDGCMALLNPLVPRKVNVHAAVCVDSYGGGIRTLTPLPWLMCRVSSHRHSPFISF